MGVARIHGEIDAADDFLVGPSQSEGVAVLNVGSRNNLDARDMRVSLNGREQESGNRENANDLCAPKMHKQPPERPQLTSLLTETNSADADFVHRCAIEFQPHNAEFGGIEWLAFALARRLKRRERSE